MVKAGHRHDIGGYLIEPSPTGGPKLQQQIPYLQIKAIFPIDQCPDDPVRVINSDDEKGVT